MLGGQGYCSQGFVPEMGQAATNKMEQGNSYQRYRKNTGVAKSGKVPWRFQNTNRQDMEQANVCDCFIQMPYLGDLFSTNTVPLQVQDSLGFIISQGLHTWCFPSKTEASNSEGCFCTLSSENTVPYFLHFHNTSLGTMSHYWHQWYFLISSAEKYQKAIQQH